MIQNSVYGLKLFPIVKNIRMDTKNKVIISLREVILGLLQFLHPVPDLLVDLRLMKWSQMIPYTNKHRDRHQQQPSSTLGCHEFWKMSYFDGKMCYYVVLTTPGLIFIKNRFNMSCRHMRILPFPLSSWQEAAKISFWP